MKKISKPDIPFSYTNLAWRVFVPMIVLVLMGMMLDRAFHIQKIFVYIAIVASFGTTIWGMYSTLKEQANENSEPVILE